MSTNAEATRNDQSYDLNSIKGLFALLLIHTIGPQTIIILPGLVQGYVEQVGMSEQDAGFLASVETWGMFIATFAMMVLVSRVRWRLLMAVSLVAMVLANLASTLTDSLFVLYVLRFIAGVGGGTIVAVSYAMIGQTTRMNRNFGWALFFVLLYGAIVFPLLPPVYSAFGINGAFVFFALFAVCGLPFVKGLPDTGGGVSEADPDAVDLPTRYKTLAVGSMLLYFIGQIAVWSYFYRFGIRYGLGEQAVGSALSVSQFAGLAGALSVVAFSRRVRKDLALFIGIVGSAVVIGAMFGTHAFIGFVAIACVYQFLWNMTHPYLLGALARFDPSGRLIVYGTAMQFLGIAVGPALAAMVIVQDSLANVLWLGIFFMLAAAAFILPPVAREHRLKHQQVVEASHG